MGENIQTTGYDGARSIDIKPWIVLFIQPFELHTATLSKVLILWFLTYLWGILGHWDILLLNLTSIGFTNFFRCQIFDLSFFTNADVATIKDETSKDNLWNPCRSYWLPSVVRIFFRCLIYEFFFFTNADVVTIKDTSK